VKAIVDDIILEYKVARQQVNIERFNF
jgi:hypothetical protein